MDRILSKLQSDVMTRLVCAVGQVCISASGLEWSLTYLSGVLQGWEDEKFTAVMSRVGQPLKEFCRVIPLIAALGVDELSTDAQQLLSDVIRLLGERNRIVHSVMMLDRSSSSQPVYEAWHPKSDTTRNVWPEDLNLLAQDLSRCAAETNAFARALTDRAEREVISR